MPRVHVALPRKPGRQLLPDELHCKPAAHNELLLDAQVAKNVGKSKSPEACEALFNKHQVYLSLAPEHQNETAFAAMAATQDQVCFTSSPVFPMQDIKSPHITNCMTALESPTAWQLDRTHYS